MSTGTPRLIPGLIPRTRLRVGADHARKADWGGVDIQPASPQGGEWGWGSSAGTKQRFARHAFIMKPLEKLRTPALAGASWPGSTWKGRGERTRELRVSPAQPSPSGSPGRPARVCVLQHTFVCGGRS